MTRLCLPALSALSLALVPTLALAQDSTVADALARVPAVAAPVLAHSDAMARVTGAMAACTLAVSDPKAAAALLQDAGWLAQPAEAVEVIFFCFLSNSSS